MSKKVESIFDIQLKNYKKQHVRYAIIFPHTCYPFSEFMDVQWFARHPSESSYYNGATNGIGFEQIMLPHSGGTIIVPIECRFTDQELNNKFPDLKPYAVRLETVPDEKNYADVIKLDKRGKNRNE